MNYKQTTRFFSQKKVQFSSITFPNSSRESEMTPRLCIPLNRPTCSVQFLVSRCCAPNMMRTPARSNVAKLMCKLSLSLLIWPRLGLERDKLLRKLYIGSDFTPTWSSEFEGKVDVEMLILLSGVMAIRVRVGFGLVRKVFIECELERVVFISNVT